jgi:hypothetical protein
LFEPEKFAPAWRHAGQGSHQTTRRHLGSDLLVLDRRHEHLADLGNETRQFPSELGPRHSRLGIDQEFFADQIVQRRENAVLCSDTASRHTLLLPDVLESLFGHGASRNGES